MHGKDAIRQVQSAPRGRVRGFRVEDYYVPTRDDDKMYLIPGGTLIPLWKPATKFKHNLILREWGAIVGRLLLREGTKYGIGGMYIEYANSASPVAPPTYDRDPDSGVEYYNSLATDPTIDYLRLQIISGMLRVSDTDLYPKGNQPTFFAMTGGTSGVHGKPFSDAADSRVIGAALVAMPDESDSTQDLVLSRFYFDESEQIPKLATGQIGIEWEITLQ